MLLVHGGRGSDCDRCVIIHYVVVIVFAVWLGCSEFIPKPGRNIRVVVCSGASPSEYGILSDRQWYGSGRDL